MFTASLHQFCNNDFYSFRFSIFIIVTANCYSSSYLKITAMKKINALLLLLVLFSACQFMGGRRVRGNGNLNSQNRNVGSFSGIRMAGSMDVILSSGTSYAVKVEADENLLNYILTEREGDALVIRTRNGYNLQPRAGMKVYVTAPSLNNIDVSGSGSVSSSEKLAAANRLHIRVSGSGDVKLDVDAPEVSTETSGSGNIILSGATRNLNSEISGSGEMQCFGLSSENAAVAISGSGSAEVFASKQLDVRVSGSGDVAYKGTPAINQHISGSGSVHSAQ